MIQLLFFVSQRLKGHVESLLKVLEEQKRENQALSDGLSLRGMWNALLEPSDGEIPIHGSYSTAADGQDYANALMWLSAGVEFFAM
jgi:hypothetical protein